MKNFFLLSKKKQIWIVVSALHFFALFALFCQHLITYYNRPTKPMIVKTYAQKSELPKVTTREQKEKPKQVNTISKTSLAKKSALKKTTSSKPIANNRPSLILPSKIETKKPSNTSSSKKSSISYEEFLIPYLQTFLDLPEYGEVKAQITLNQSGKLIDFKILSAKSSKNADFLKHELFELSFPPLSDFGILDSSKNFTVLFKNF